MTSDLPFEQPSFDFDLFFSAYWRKRPLYVPGGAKELLGRVWTDDDFDAALAGARADGTEVKERPGEVTFIEQVSRFDTGLRDRADRLAGVFGAPQAWFDAIRTYARSGIGAHFDHSDNFVLQQNGTKEWTLASSEHLDRQDVVRRMMNHPGVGAHDLPDGDSVRFTVGPGDLLYIPLLWLHSGVSRGDSLSVSLVCPAVSLQAAVLPLLAQVLRARGVGHQPVPALHTGLSPQQRADATAALARATRAFLERMSDDALADAVLALQHRRLTGESARPATDTA
ncbi:JmjC domain-containing protein [Streptomyces cyanogenus]|uniref:Ribosomal oxygenase n=1 Tax=Streptomyces cyanogenus TaxID=80860 RepID=A0ABX7U0B0_STRCY|nr:cupin domain-containing protein [Streptomyces cyanogenus]QTE02468.1 putative ribosomal oxygenase [Streptomyces cyanogenus]